MYDFIQQFAPHLTPDVVKQVQACSNRAEIEELFAHQVLPDM
jgi:LysR family cys regulon transcriptional activator